MTATIGLQDVRIHAPHGFFEEEHLMGNEFSVDVEVEASIGGAASEDDLGQTVNYATIYYLLQAEMKKPTQLLEALAYRMGERIINQFDNATAVKLKLRKLNPPLGGKVGAAFVEISLAASGTAPSRRQDTFEDPLPGGYGVSDEFGHPGSSGAFGDRKTDGFTGGASGSRSGSGMMGFPSKPNPHTPPAIMGAAGGVDDDAFDEDFEGFAELVAAAKREEGLVIEANEDVDRGTNLSELIDFDAIDDDAFDEEFDEEAFDELGMDGLDFDDMDFGDFDFDPKDLK